MLQQLSERVYFAAGGTNIGVVVSDDNRVVLIDSGLNDTPSRKVLRAVSEELKTEIRAIVNTHGHADHFGGNRFLVNRTNCRVYAPDVDELTLRHPMMQPVMLYGGADPVDAIRTRFLVAEDSPVHGIVEAGRQNIEGISIEVVSLPGHSINQMGFVIDDVFFCADVVFPTETLKKYPIPYVYGLTDHLDALAYALTIESKIVVPGHGPVAESIGAHVEENRVAIDRTISAILDVLDQPMMSDAVCAKVFEILSVPVGDVQAYYLLRPTLNAYLSHMQRSGHISLEVSGSSVVWRRL